MKEYYILATQHIYKSYYVTAESEEHARQVAEEEFSNHHEINSDIDIVDVIEESDIEESSEDTD